MTYAFLKLIFILIFDLVCFVSWQSSLKCGDLIIGKLKGYDWWFGKIIKKKTKQKSQGLGSCWVRWYGDNKLSEVWLRLLRSKLETKNLKSLKEWMFSLVLCFLSRDDRVILHVNLLSGNPTKWSNTFKQFVRVILHVNLLSGNPTKWSNTFKQFVGNSQWIVWVCLTMCCGVGAERVNSEVYLGLYKQLW